MDAGLPRIKFSDLRSMRVPEDVSVAPTVGQSETRLIRLWSASAFLLALFWQARGTFPSQIKE